MKEKIYVILLAGGSGTRMHAGVNKVLLPVAGIPCIARSALAFVPFADHLILVVKPEEEAALGQALAEIALPFPVSFAPGGATRQESVHHGLQLLGKMEPEDAIVLIHDGARCLVEEKVIQAALDSVSLHGSGIAAIPATDTLRQADEHFQAGPTIPREQVWAMQTPQAARLRSLLAAFDQAEQEGFTGTDDAAILAHAGYPVFLSPGSRTNLKLTTQEDLLMAEAILQQEKPFPDLRIGQGYDVHQLTTGRKLILCGVEVPHTHGLLGHSDADVALHALMDALLGAAGMGDIGRHFPDTDMQYKGIDSMKLLAKVMEKLTEAGFRPVNVDLTIVAQRPKLAPYIPQMAQNVATSLGLPLSQVNVKATTTEHLGFEGRMEGISSQAVCLLQKMS
ncbi:MAG: 2-C-methyl-D-erythritol 2,4-cyclodiphosphate synthase [Clostridia bacterium]|nr:2-C-methyl-D-erythritol 2,4-cyclodiphosphate synthase [Clostridia bacterium]